MKTVLITGGSRGIGAEMVRCFSRAGYRTAFLYRENRSAAEAVAAETEAIAMQADLASGREILRAAKAVCNLFGDAPDVLINNAAVAGMRLFTDITDDEWERFLSINLSAPFRLTRALLPDMIRRKSGCILNVSSIWGQVGASCEVHYSATKAGLIGLTRALAKEVGPSGVRVNCIAPGVIDTDMNADLTPEEIHALCEETPLCRLGRPEEVAAAALFLAGPGGSFITGQILGVNGGFVI